MGFKGVHLSCQKIKRVSVKQIFYIQISYIYSVVAFPNMLFLARLLELEGILVIHFISKLWYLEPHVVLGMFQYSSKSLIKIL